MRAKHLILKMSMSTSSSAVRTVEEEKENADAIVENFT